MSRRGWTMVVSGVLVLVFALVGAFVRVPYVALGPGPTYNTLGTVDGHEVVSVDGQRSFPADGELRMTTVSLNDDMTLFGALGLWLSGRFALAPRENYFRPGQTDEEVRRQNLRQFRVSQSNAEVAALRRLGHPVQVVVAEVEKNSPADGVLKPGDRLLRVDGREVADSAAVHEALADTRPGQTVSLTVRRDGEGERTVRVTLTNRPDNRPQGFVGFQPSDRADVPFEIDIALEDVGGPSAGLMFALAIVDRLTQGDLTGGRHVAGTGEIDAQGNVGEIGGISFKLVAAREAGATSFLVPSGNCDEAVASAPDGLRLIEVGHLDDAVHALEALNSGEPVPTCAS
nr:PDZ domain-containing protein [Saccharomonospora saliphila]